jgi:hypothetical protein
MFVVLMKEKYSSLVPQLLTRAVFGHQKVAFANQPVHFLGHP